MLLDDKGLQERVARMETLLEEIEALKDPNARSKAAEVVGVLLDLYGDCLARMMEVVARGEERERNFEAFAQAPARAAPAGRGDAGGRGPRRGASLPAIPWW